MSWWKRWRINRLLVTRAGLVAEDKADQIAGEVDYVVHRHLGEINERLRQLGYTEAP